MKCHVRQPAALALSADGAWLYVANRRSGTVSVVETSSSRVAAEHAVGRGLADVAALGDGNHLLAVDRDEDTLLLLETRAESIRVAQHLGVAADPATVLVALDGRSCVVASTGSQRLTFVEISSVTTRGERTLAVRRTLELPFSPRNLALAGPRAKLIAADAFGGKLAVIDRESGAIESVRTLPAHNIRGLAVTPDGKELVVAHQVLRQRARTDFEDVHWGRLLTSHLRSLRLDAVLTPGSDADLIRDGDMIDFGSPYDGAGDPSALASDRSGLLAVALGGVGEVSLGRGPTSYFRRHRVGGQPSALALSRDGSTLFVADSATETIAVVEVKSGRRLPSISLGPRPEPTLAERGERLFHDARLSLDGWMSCHSCHTDGHSNGQLGDTLGDGSYGAPKRVPSLLGVGSTGPWAWTGTMIKLEDQVRKSVERTMRGRRLSDEQVEALTAYLRSLPPPRRFAVADLQAPARRGLELFRSRDCATCHAPPDYTTPRRYDVGLVDEAGNRQFNPPSLRGVGRREPLLHDGRAATLKDVFLTHGHPGDSDLSPEQVADLVAYLKTL